MHPLVVIAGAALLAAPGLAAADTTAPAVQSFTSSQASPTGAASFTYTLAMTEAVTGLGGGAFSNAGTDTGCVFSPGASGGTSFTITVTGCTGGTVIPRLSAGSVTDGAGNAGPSAASDATTTVVFRPTPLLYAVNNGSANVSAFRTGATGALAALSPMNTASGGVSPWFLADSPDGRTLYVTNGSSNTVTQFRIGATGALSSIASTATGASPQGLAVHPSGRVVYVANVNANTISQYAVSADGTLSPLAQPTVSTTGCSGPREMAITRDGMALFVSCQSSDKVGRFTIDQATGQLASAGAPATAGTTPFTVTASPVADYLYVVARGTTSGSPLEYRNAKVFQYKISAGAGLTPLPTPDIAVPFAHSAGINPAGTRLAVGIALLGGGTEKAQMLPIDPATGQLGSAITAPNAPASTQLYSPDFLPDGSAVYFGLGIGNGVAQASVAGDGVMTAMSPASLSAGSTTHKIAVVDPVIAASTFITPTASPTASLPTFEITFTRPIVGLDPADFTVSGTATGVSVASVTGSGAGPYTVTLSAAVGATAGTIELQLGANTVGDLAGDTGPAVATWPANYSPTVTWAPVAPVVINGSVSIAVRGGGAAQVGSTLDATRGQWTSSIPISGYGHQWQRCERDGTACVDIIGATGTSYIVTANDIRMRLQVRASATTSAGTGTALSNATDVVPASAVKVNNTPVVTRDAIIVNVSTLRVGTVTVVGATRTRGRWIARCVGRKTVAGATTGTKVACVLTPASRRLLCRSALRVRLVTRLTTPGMPTASATRTVRVAKRNCGPPRVAG